MTRFLVVPTRNDHPDLLAALVQDCGLPLENIVIVATQAGLDLPVVGHVRHDFGVRNIQRWWNLGIACAESSGAIFVTVVNDDVTLTPETIPTMIAALARMKGDLCWAKEWMTGWCWTLRVSSNIRPDERFQWWCGDTDMNRQAVETGRLVHVSTDAVHHHPDEFTKTPEIQEMIKRDWTEYEKKWGP